MVFCASRQYSYSIMQPNELKYHYNNIEQKDENLSNESVDFEIRKTMFNTSDTNFDLPISFKERTYGYIGSTNSMSFYVKMVKILIRILLSSFLLFVVRFNYLSQESNHLFFNLGLYVPHIDNIRV